MRLDLAVIGFVIRRHNQQAREHTDGEAHPLLKDRLVRNARPFFMRQTLIDKPLPPGLTVVTAEKSSAIEVSSVFGAGLSAVKAGEMIGWRLPSKPINKAETRKRNRHLTKVSVAIMDLPFR